MTTSSTQMTTSSPEHRPQPDRYASHASAHASSDGTTDPHLERHKSATFAYKRQFAAPYDARHKAATAYPARSRLFRHTGESRQLLPRRRLLPPMSARAANGEPPAKRPYKRRLPTDDTRTAEDIRLSSLVSAVMDTCRDFASAVSSSAYSTQEKLSLTKAVAAFLAGTSEEPDLPTDTPADEVVLRLLCRLILLKSL